MYHDVLKDDGRATGRDGVGPGHYKVTWGTFIEHLDRIREAIGASPALVVDPPGGVSWSLTFDDGGASALDVAEELSRREWRAHFFITTGLMGSSGFLDADAVRALDRMGHVIGSHSVTHPTRMAALPRPELVYEWQASVETLSALLGKPVRTASVPGGHYRARVAAAAAEAGIATLFTSEPVRTTRRVGSCLVLGRYAIREHTSAQTAAAAAAGDPATWLRQYVGWTLRKPVKALPGDPYDRVRRALLAARSTRARPQ
jgi:hypothetical protein